MPQRNLFDLSSYSYTTGEIGRLQTLAVIPTLPGDSFQFDVQGMYRLADLRTEMVQDAKIDIFYFWRPHRHSYPNWQQFIQEGSDTDEVLAAGATNGGTLIYDFLTYNSTKTDPPKWLTEGYDAIYNRYFKHPDDPDASFGATSDVNVAAFGARVGRLPHTKYNPRRAGTTSGLTTERDLEATDDDYTINVVSNQVTVDLRDMERVRGIFRSEVLANTYSNRYEEVIRTKFGGKANTDADPRPTLLWRHSLWSSGMEINATDTTSLGSYVGKVFGSINHQVPRKYIPEHGAIFVMAAVRFPTVYEDERHWLITKGQPLYSEIAGDPIIAETTEPETYQSNHWADFQVTDAEYVSPSYDWFRYQPNRVSEQYQTVDGFPFGPDAINIDTIKYFRNGEYDAVFNSAELNQWRMTLRIGCDVLRNFPDQNKSWMAGTR